MYVDLSVPDEPTDLQEIVAENVARSEGDFDPDVDRRLPVTDPSPGRVILGTEIQTYLWRAWERDLRAVDLDYLSFRNVLTYAAATIARWATGEGEWDAVVERVEGTIEEMGEELTDPLSL